MSQYAAAATGSSSMLALRTCTGVSEVRRQRLVKPNPHGRAKIRAASGATAWTIYAWWRSARRSDRGGSRGWSS
jgi:hypothetical protein